MVTLLLIISLAVLIVGIVVLCKKPDTDGAVISSIFLIVLGAAATIGFGAWDIVEIEKIATSQTIEQKIEMYEEENAKIESDIDAIVKAYMEHEKDVYESLKTESSITLVSYFPELKSDEMIQQQIDVYQSNASKIRQLKVIQIDIPISRWRVYFGH